MCSPIRMKLALCSLLPPPTCDAIMLSQTKNSIATIVCRDWQSMDFIRRVCNYTQTFEYSLDMSALRTCRQALHQEPQHL